MNEPLVHGKYTFYQSGILPSGTGTVLTVASDPGLFLKYLGSIMTCAGTLIMFVTRSKLAKVLPFLSSQTTTKTKEQLMRRAIAASLAFVCLAGSAFAASSPDQQFDWNAWRSLPVQDGGRQKPLDSLAWETWRLLGNRVSFTDPETNQSLDATAFYVATMLDSPTWDKKLPSPSGRGAGRAAVAGSEMPAQAGDLLRLRRAERRRQVGRHAPAAWSIRSNSASSSAWRPTRSTSRRGTCSKPRSSRRESQKPTTFMVWAQQLVFKPENELSPLEKKGVELFNRLRAYQDHRAGRRLEILPVPGSAEKQWISLDSLLRMKLDDADRSRAVRCGNCARRSPSCGRPTWPIRPPSSTRPRTSSWAWSAKWGRSSGPIPRGA